MLRSQLKLSSANQVWFIHFRRRLTGNIKDAEVLNKTVVIHNKQHKPEIFSVKIYGTTRALR